MKNIYVKRAFPAAVLALLLAGAVHAQSHKTVHGRCGTELKDAHRVDANANADTTRQTEYQTAYQRYIEISARQVGAASARAQAATH